MDLINTVVNVQDGTTTTVPLTPAEQAAYVAAQTAQTAQIAAAAQAAADDQATQTAVSTLIQSCVGITWTNLTVAQKQALIVALLYRAGALDKNLTVQPLTTWLKR